VVIHTHTRERGEGRPKKNKEKPKNYLSHILSPLTKKKKNPNLFSLHQSSQNKEREEEKKKKENDRTFNQVDLFPRMFVCLFVSPLV